MAARNVSDPPIKFFAAGEAFRSWLAKNHDRARELYVAFYKKSTGKNSITYPEALDHALAFGWIDGVRKALDESSYTIRFTPRKPGSTWSAVNIRRVGVLTASGAMMPPGLAAFQNRLAKNTGRYSYEQRPRTLEPADEKIFRGNPQAWTFFEAQPAGYRRTAIWYVVSAVKEETRRKRLDILIRDSAEGRRLGLLTSKPATPSKPAGVSSSGPSPRRTTKRSSERT
jgi:uncharacterized protein YdeI (YjbR/CyaY-like superfamily)